MSAVSKLPLAGRLTFFYGWRIVALGLLLNLMTAGLSSSAFSVFVKPMGDDLGWSRASIVLAVTIATLAAAVSGHFLGLALDKRHGARLLTTGGMLTIGISTIFIGQVRESWHLYSLFFIAGAVGLAAYPGLITPTIVSKWFVRRRGMAISFASMGLPSSGFILSPYANLLIDQLGWRDAWIVLGLTALAVTVPACALFMRRRPEDIGLRPDGDDPAAQRNTGEMMPVVPDEHSWTIPQAIRTRAFWLMLISSSLGMFCFIGVLINFFAFASDASIGFTSGQAGWAFATFSFISLAAKVPWAYLSRPPRYPGDYCLHLCSARHSHGHTDKRRLILDAHFVGSHIRNGCIGDISTAFLRMGGILRKDLPGLHKGHHIPHDLLRSGHGPAICRPAL